MDPILFGPFCLDIDQRRLFRDGTDLKLRPQAVRVLRVLLQRTGQSVHYDQLLKEAWDGTFISRHTVATTVSEIRKALEEYGGWIEYRPRIGYALKVLRSDDQIRTGWHLSERRTREGLEKAMACFEQDGLFTVRSALSQAAGRCVPRFDVNWTLELPDRRYNP